MIKRLLFKTNQGASNLAECGPREKKKKGRVGTEGVVLREEVSPPPRSCLAPGATGSNREEQAGL